MKPETVLIGFVVFAFVFGSGVYIFGDVNYHYGTALNLSEYSTFNHADDLYNITDDFRSTQLEAEVAGDEDTSNSLVKAGYKAIRTLFDLPSIFGSMVYDISRIFGLPPFVATFINVVFIISLLVMVTMLWLRLRN